MNAIDGDADPHDQRLVRERQAPPRVGDDPADERGGEDGQPAHRRRALLGHVVLGPVVLLAEDRLAEPARPERGDEEPRDDQRQHAGDDPGDHDGDHVRRSSSRRTTARSSNGTTFAPMVCVVSWPLPATTTTSPGLANSQRPLDRRRSILLDVDLRAIAGGDAGDDRVDDRPRSLRPRVVRRHDHAIGQLRRNRAHLRTLACDPDHRRTRTPRGRTPSVIWRAAPRISASPSGVWA